MVGKVLIRLFSALALFKLAAADCRLTDVSNILGGSDYEVLDIKAEHMTYTIVNFLAVTSTVRKTGASTNTIFVYLFDYSMCTTSF